MADGVSIRRLHTGSIQLEVAEAGVGGKPLLLVHGFTGAKEDFTEWLGPLARRGWHAVAPDLRGHGRSDHPVGESAYSLSLFAADVAALADQLGWDRFTLLGHSMGGMVAQVAALDLGPRLEALVLMDTSPAAPEGFDPEAMELGKAIVRSSGLATLVELQANRDDPLTTPAHSRLVKERLGYEQFGQDNTLAASADMWVTMVDEIFHQEDRLARLAGLDLPVLVVVGEQDAPFMAHALRMADIIPGARLEVIPDAGHSPQFEAPEAWWRALSSFLDSVAGANRPTPAKVTGHGGELAVAALRERGVDIIYTLSGGHIFPLYDGCVKQGVRILDVRHEQTATFAAEGAAKLTRGVGVAALTAGPGVTNGMSAITTAHLNGSPLLVLAGRAPQRRWGAGSLQELDHVPLVQSVTKLAATVTTTPGCGRQVAEAADAAVSPHRGPVFLDFPMDVLFGSGEVEIESPTPAGGTTPDPDEVAKAAALIAGASRPALIAGGDVWWGRAETALAHCVQELRIPAFANGLGRGCLPADHELAFSRTRRALKEADVVVVVGTPLDFRLGFGRYGDAQVIHIVDHVSQRAGHTPVAASPAGDLTAILEGLAAYAGPRADHEPWIMALRDQETAAREAERAELTSDSWPIHPARVYGELRPRLDRDAVVVCDGGDFVSYAGKLVDSYQPGCWLDPGPYGCLGTGMGYSIAARTVHPDRQVVAMLGDGAFGFAGMDVDSLVRHGLPVVMVVGNNGIWGLEKHPMQAMYGYDVAADLQPGCRYDEVVRALGGAGETVEDPAQIGPALDRAFASGVPYMVNVITDPAVAYPRSSNLG